MFLFKKDIHVLQILTRWIVLIRNLVFKSKMRIALLWNGGSLKIEEYVMMKKPLSPIKHELSQNDFYQSILRHNGLLKIKTCFYKRILHCLSVRKYSKRIKKYIKRGQMYV